MNERLPHLLQTIQSRPAKDYISGKNLPKDYKGFSTERLLDLLKMRLSGNFPDNVPVEEIRAMDHLDREYRLSPIFNVKP